MQTLSIHLASAMRKPDPYQHFKNAILDHYKPSSASSFDKFFRRQEMGPLKPSEFLSRIMIDFESTQININDHSNQVMLKEFFIASLPQHIRSILAGTVISDVGELALLADRIFDVQPSTQSNSSRSNIHAVTTPTDEPWESAISALTSQVSNLTMAVGAFTANKPKPPVRQEKTIPVKQPVVSRQEVQTQLTKPTGLTCSYHDKFKDKAYKCQTGCNYPNKDKSLEILPLCVYHARFGDRAMRCMSPCPKFINRNNNQPSDPKNLSSRPEGHRTT